MTLTRVGNGQERSMSDEAHRLARSAMLDTPTSSSTEVQRAIRSPVGGPPGGHSATASVRGLSLAANFRWTFAGNGVNAVCQWGMLAVLARVANVGAVGQFVLGISIAGPILSLAMLQLRSVQVTDVRNEFSFGDYFGTRIAWTAIGLLAIAVCGTAVGEDGPTMGVILAVGAMKSVDSVCDVVRGLFQRHERMDLSGMSLLVKGPLSLIALATTMWLSGNLVLATCAAAAAWTVSLVVNDLRPARRLLVETFGEAAGPNLLRPRFALPSVLRLTWIALPLGIVMALISLQTNIPRYFLKIHSGNEALGYFGAIVYPMMAGMMVTTAMGQSAAPRLARHFVEDLSAYRRLLIRLSLISAGLGLALIVGTYALGDAALRVLYGPEYAAYSREFVVLSVAWGIQLVSSCCGYGLTSARYFRAQVMVTAVSCLTTALAAWLWVPSHGVMGAAAAVLVTSLTMAVGFAAGIVSAIRARARSATEAIA